eukprot:RCo043716
MAGSAGQELSQLLGEEEMVWVRFHTDAFELGFLQGPDEALKFALAEETQEEQGALQERANDIKKGALVAIPLWLAKALRGGNFISVVTPEHYTSAFFRRTGPVTADLGSKAPNFYISGRLLASLLAEAGASEQLMALLVEVYGQRFAAVLKSAEHGPLDPTDLRGSLDASERRMFDILHSTERKKLEWMNHLLPAEAL